MAFSLDVSLPEVEYRGCRSGTSSSGRVWMSLIFEDYEANQIEASVPADMQSEVYSLGLTRGDMCAISIRAVARADGNSYVQLKALPEILEGDED